MEMKTALSVFFAVAAMRLLAGGPVVREGSVTVSQDRSRKVTITYALDDAPAVVTVDVLTNGVSIGSANFTNMTGDVNVMVPTGDLHTVTWKASRSWPFHDGNAVVKVKAWPLDAPPDYLVVYDLTRDGCVRYYADADGIPGGVTNGVYKTEQLIMRRIHANCRTFRMNSPNTHLRRVSFTNDYYMGIYFLTQGQAMQTGAFAENPSYCQGEEYPDHLKYPLENVSPEDFRGKYEWPDGGHTNVTPDSVVGILSARTGLTFDMPTDAEWEYAMRAGSDERYFWGASMDLSVCTNYVWMIENSGSSEERIMPHEVGLLRPNPWGIYDCYGLIYQHTLDRQLNGDVLPEGYFVNPVGPAATHSVRCSTRGGRGDFTIDKCDSNFRRGVAATSPNANNGFRLMCLCPQEAQD